MERHAQNLSEVKEQVNEDSFRNGRTEERKKPRTTVKKNPNWKTIDSDATPVKQMKSYDIYGSKLLTATIQIDHVFRQGPGDLLDCAIQETKVFREEVDD